MANASSAYMSDRGNIHHLLYRSLLK